jgi:hypothetical protein
VPASTSRGRGRAPLERRDRPRAVSRQPAVRHPQAELGAPLAGDDHELGVLEQRLEVDVPDPRHVLPVGDRVVERDDEDGGTRLERPDDLVRPGGFLIEEQHDGLAAGADPLEPPERGAEPRETRAHVLE